MSGFFWKKTRALSEQKTRPIMFITGRTNADVTVFHEVNPRESSSSSRDVTWWDWEEFSLEKLLRFICDSLCQKDKCW